MRSECLEVQRGWPSRTCAAWEIGGDLDCMPLYWIRYRSWPIFMLPLKEGDRFYGVEDVGVHPRCEGGLPVASQRSTLPVNAMIHGCQYCQSTINVTESSLSLLHVRRAQTLLRKRTDKCSCDKVLSPLKFNGLLFTPDQHWRCTAGQCRVEDQVGAICTVMHWDTLGSASHRRNWQGRGSGYFRIRRLSRPDASPFHRHHRHHCYPSSSSPTLEYREAVCA